MAGSIRYIKFRGNYKKFDECKEKTKALSMQKGIMKCLTKEQEIIKEEDTEYDDYLLKIYEVNRKAWPFPGNQPDKYTFLVGEAVQL